MNAINRCDLSVIVPAFNESENLEALVDQVDRAFEGCDVTFELIIVDDCSDDTTSSVLAALATERPWLRTHRHAKRLGQSAAMYTAIDMSRGCWVGMLDADLQNDPADLVKYFQLAATRNIDMVQGYRARRKDGLVKKITSRVGRLFRRMLLNDPIRDTGCSTRIMRSQFAKAQPLFLHGMHRFIPVYARSLGAIIDEHEANHRPRHAGVTKYGITNRAWSGLMDCLSVRWMLKRMRCSPVRQSQQGVCDSEK